MKAQSGAAGIVASALVMVALLGALLLVDVAHVVALRTDLTTAADAAALAAAPATFAQFGSGSGPDQAAAELAAANGVELVGCSCPVDRSWRVRTVHVTVGVDVRLVLLGDRYLTATSAAEFRPVALGLAER